MNMEISSSKMQIMKPVVLKAGIPLAVTLAGFIAAKIATRGSSPPATSSPPSTTQANFQNTDSCHIHHEEKCCELQEEVLGLKCKFEDFQDSKEQEIALMELHNKFMLEAEKQRFDNYVRRTENKQLRKRVKKLLRKTEEHARISRKNNVLIVSKETEISNNKIELEAKDDRIRLMEDEIRDLKQQNEQLLREKNELSAKSEAEGEMTKIENDNQLACELKDEATEFKESMIYLRWRNACLRHELMVRNQEQEQNKEIEHNFGGIVEIEEFVSDHELSICHVGQSDSNLGLTARNHHHSKRRKLIEKLKRWVEKEKHGKNKSVSDGVEEAYFSARKSCSSA